VAVIDQFKGDNYMLYNGDSAEVLQSLPEGCVDFSIYSPPFAQPGGGALYHYSSSPRDLSNARTFPEFLEHYGVIVRELARLTKPGRLTAVHCADVPTGNTGCDHMFDLPGEIIRLHESLGFRYAARYCIWKEPLAVRNRTLAKNLAHKTIVEDSADCSNASADYLILFRRKGDNAVPIAHPNGFDRYIGEREVPRELLPYKGWTGKQTGNRYSHWIWRQYASSFWDDIRLDRVLPYREARDAEDEKHVHPLQLDVIERAVALWTNPGDVVLTPFMGVGSEVYGAVSSGRKGIGCELKPSYYRQAVKNLALAKSEAVEKQVTFDFGGDAPSETMDDAESSEPDAAASPASKPAKRPRKSRASTTVAE
jgi:DNA modification methylase